MEKISLIAKVYIAVVVMTGAAVLVNGLLHWKSGQPIELIALLVMTLIASRLKVKLPGINGTLSVNVPYLLIVAVRLDAGPALAIAALASLVQSLAAFKVRTTFIQGIFSSAAITNSVAAAIFAFNLASTHGVPGPLSVSAAGAAFFLANTVQVALVLWLAEGRNPFNAWRGMARLSTPYYVLSAAVAAVVCAVVQFAIWGEALALLPLMYSVYSSYRIYFAAPTAVQEQAAVTKMHAGAAAITSATLK